ncbi:hypothetical protein F5Y19DRAFT_472907 [Xylariaceae sp. FL1651]|nr:hypothetical protein F5Y19DRAFT_472907 [Xylariaceae sp. FL1651]
MGPFALSVPGYRLGVHSRKKPRRSQAQRDTQSPSPETEIETQTQSSSRPPSDIINPLSHSPDTLHQLALAGLSPEDELPSKICPAFPHKPLPAAGRSRKRGRGRRMSMSAAEGSGVDTDSSTATTITRRRGEDGEEGNGGNGSRGGDRSSQHSARIRHLNIMTAVMHRCLRDGDIARAKRAFGLLVRTRDVDVRIDNLWAVGSEILMRDGEAAPKLPSQSQFQARQQHPVIDTQSIAGVHANTEERGEEEEAEEERARQPPPRRWGSASNAAQVKTYLETLIQQHPYDAHRPHLTSAVDFWPALFGIEVYNLDAEFQGALHHIHLEYGFPASPLSSAPSSPLGHRHRHRRHRRRRSSGGEEGSDYEMADVMDLDDDDDDTFSGSRRRRRMVGEEDGDEEEEHVERHRATDALRAETQRGALALATRMDGVLENPPYATHAELLRLRGHVSLFIGDLYLPSRLVERYHARGRMGREGGRPVIEDRMQGLSLRGSDLLRAHVDRPEEHVAVGRRKEEQERARAFFRRALEAGERLEEWILQFLDPEDDDEQGDEEEY